MDLAELASLVTPSATVEAAVAEIPVHSNSQVSTAMSDIASQNASSAASVATTAAAAAPFALKFGIGIVSAIFAADALALTGKPRRSAIILGSMIGISAGIAAGEHWHLGIGGTCLGIILGSLIGAPIGGALVKASSVVEKRGEEIGDAVVEGVVDKIEQMTGVNPVAPVAAVAAATVAVAAAVGPASVIPAAPHPATE